MIDVPAMTSASTWIDRLLGLTEFSWSDPQAGWSWRYPLPGWAWVVLVVLAAGLAGWSYHRLAGRRRVRAVLAGLRFALILTIAALLIGPRLVLTQELVEPDTLVMLVDRSASMRIRDAQTPDGSGTAQVSREDALRAALSKNQDLFGPSMLGQDRRVMWLGFDLGAYAIEAPGAWRDSPPMAVGRGTALRTAIEQVLERTAGRPIGGIVIFSDGRSPQAIGTQLVHRLQQAVATVFVVPIGDPRGIGDLAITQVTAPDAAFIKDTVPVTVWLDLSDVTTYEGRGRVQVTLRDAVTQTVLDQRVVPVTSISKPVRLAGVSQSVGQAQWQVHVQWADDPDASSRATHREELVPENNTRQITVRFVDRPIRVLYVEGSPRWQYRYLNSLLTRERSISGSVLLVSADRGFVQEGDRPVTRFPRTPRELLPYDVVIVGDVPAGYFEPDQLEMLRDHVAAHGLGVIWIGGTDHTPGSYLATPIADLLPMRQSAVVGGTATVSGAITVVPTPLAAALQVMQLDEVDAAHPGGSQDWPRLLPPLTWAQVITPLVPAAEVLAVGERHNAPDVPLVTRLRYGAGQSVYVATDETWRWRYGVGDGYFERFWVQLIRMLGRHRLQGTGHEAVLTVSQRRIELGQSVVLQLNVPPDALGTDGLSKVAVEVLQPNDQRKPTTQNGDRTDRIGVLELLREDLDRQEQLDHVVASTAFRTLWRPRTAGVLRLRIIEPALADTDLQASVQVIRPDNEMQNPLPDHARLAALAEATGGRVVPLDQLRDLAELVPNRARRTPNDISEPLWDSPISFLVVLTLLAAEWVGRKMIRLI